jgi:hypothetical protein
MDWPTELQALARKDGPTIATALCQVADSVMTGALAGRVEPQRRVRFINILTGDGINTNENAAKRLLWRYRNGWFRDNFIYLLILWKCASHISNLVVSSAICGVGGQGSTARL